MTIARRAFEQWRKVEATHPGEYLELIAAEMRNRRFELAAWMVYECGKPWMEADGDVAGPSTSAPYAGQMRLLDVPVQCDYPRRASTSISRGELRW
ncbi:MAG: aldehyde dehydrogenase family protein [Planctomycetaceae bacterium]